MNNDERLMRAKKNGYGIQFTIDVYVPIPANKRRTKQHAREARVNILEEIKPTIDNLQSKIQSLNGIANILQG